MMLFILKQGLPICREILIIAFLEDIITQSVDLSLHDFIFTEAKVGLLSILK